VDSFQLRAAYVRVFNPYNNAGRGQVYVLQNSTSGAPTSTILTQAAMPFPPPSNTWIYVQFPTFISFSAMQNFHLAYGPAPAGPYPSGTGWWPSLDGVPTGNRNYMASGTSTLPTTWLAQSYGDYMIMAGGEYLAAFTDLEAKNAYTSTKLFWNLPGTVFNFKATVRNVGMTTVGDYTACWQVYSQSSLLWTSSSVYTGFASGQTVSIAAADTWSTTTPGMYNVRFYVDAPLDENASNDTTWLEIYVTDLNDIPYTYSHEALYGNTTLNRWGISYNLPQTPAKVDSFKIYFNQACAAGVSILLNDGASSAPQTMLWGDTVAVDTGWHNFMPDNLTISQSMFTVAYTGASPLSTSPSGINSAANDSMMTTAWTGATWTKLYSGDWPFVVFLSPVSTTPPQITDLMISVSGIDIILDWTDVTQAASYNIYRSDNPYFTTGTVYATTTVSTYTDLEAVTSDTAWFYFVTAVN